MIEIKKTDVQKLTNKLSAIGIEHNISISGAIEGQIILPRGDGSNDYCFLYEMPDSKDKIRLSLRAGAKSFKGAEILNTVPHKDNEQLLSNLIKELI